MNEVEQNIKGANNETSNIITGIVTNAPDERLYGRKIHPNSLKNLKPFKAGIAPNPAGRPVGARDYATIYKEALVKLAKMKDLTPEELETSILKGGLLRATQGDYRFYKDTLDRLHGMATQKTELTHAIRPTPILGNLTENNIPTDVKNFSEKEVTPLIDKVDNVGGNFSTPLQEKPLV